MHIDAADFEFLMGKKQYREKPQCLLYKDPLTTLKKVCTNSGDKFSGQNGILLIV